MTKQYFIELADFNVWANDIVHSWLNAITDEQWEKPIVSSFNSIRETVLHVIGAEIIWLERLKNVSAPVWLPQVFKGSKEELIENWKKASADLKVLVENFDDNGLDQPMIFKRLNGEENRMPHYQVFAHVFNHSTYHRGQLVTMLRQAGYTDVRSTDMLMYFREKNN